jgi:predicted nucleotidyltransferase
MAQAGKLDLKATSLSQAEAQALRAFVNQLQELFSQQVLQLALFGSKARGESGPDSDVDVLVIVDREDRSLRREIIDIASDLSLEYDVLLSPRVIGIQRWKARQNFMLYSNIARDALPIPISRS